MKLLTNVLKIVNKSRQIYSESIEEHMNKNIYGDLV